MCSCIGRGHISTHNLGSKGRKGRGKRLSSHPKTHTFLPRCHKPRELVCKDIVDEIPLRKKHVNGSNKSKGNKAEGRLIADLELTSQYFLCIPRPVSIPNFVDKLLNMSVLKSAALGIVHVTGCPDLPLIGSKVPHSASGVHFAELPRKKGAMSLG